MSAQAVPLKDFVRLRRKQELTRGHNSWIRDCASKKIPGAFQFAGKGKWFIDLATYDREVHRMASGESSDITLDPAIAKIIASLGLSEDDVKVAASAAR